MKAKKLVSSILAIAMISTSMSHNVFAATGDVVLEGAQVKSKIGGDFSVNFNLTSVPSTGFRVVNLQLNMILQKLQSRVLQQEVLQIQAPQKQN